MAGSDEPLLVPAAASCCCCFCWSSSAAAAADPSAAAVQVLLVSWSFCAAAHRASNNWLASTGLKCCCGLGFGGAGGIPGAGGALPVYEPRLLLAALAYEELAGEV